MKIDVISDTYFYSNNIENLKSSVRAVTDIFATKKEYLQRKPHLNGIKWREVTTN